MQSPVTTYLSCLNPLALASNVAMNQSLHIYVLQGEHLFNSPLTECQEMCSEYSHWLTVRWYHATQRRFYNKMLTIRCNLLNTVLNTRGRTIMWVIFRSCLSWMILSWTLVKSGTICLKCFFKTLLLARLDLWDCSTDAAQPILWEHDTVGCLGREWIWTLILWPVLCVPRQWYD